MRKSLAALALVAIVATSGCASMRRSRTPDEFAVTRSAPLIVPPNFSLAPPVTGTAGLSPSDAQQQAIDSLFGGPAPRSPSEISLLELAGRDLAQIGIRSTVWDPDTRIVDKGPTTLNILATAPTNTSVASATTGQ